MTPTLLWDLGGVLVQHHPDRAIARLAKATRRTIPEIEDAVMATLKLGFDSGRLDTPTFLASASRACPGLDTAAIAEAWCDIFDDEPETQGLARRLAASGPAYLLSNTDPLHFNYLRHRLPWLDEFSGFHLSYEVGLLKPDPQYYRLAFARFGLRPEGCVLIDDKRENVEAAQGLGVVGILHRGFASTRAALASMGLAA